MNTYKWFGITMAAALLAGGVIVFKSEAAERGAGEGRFRGKILERAKEKLGLTDEQAAKIKAELKTEKSTITTQISALHEARVGLREAIQAADATEATVRAASAKVAAAEADLAVERLKLYGKISPILNEEQRQKVKAFQAKIDDFVDNIISRIGEHLSE